MECRGRVLGGLIPLLVAAGPLCAAASASATGGTSDAGALATIAGHCSGAHAVPTEASAARARAAMLCLVNRFRDVHRRPALRANARLVRAAQAYTTHMASARFFSHTAPGGGTMVGRLREAGYIGTGGSWTVGENLGWGTHSSAAPVMVFEGWLASPTHRANLLRAGFREAGVGVAYPAPSGTTGATYALEFGTRH